MPAKEMATLPLVTSPGKADDARQTWRLRGGGPNKMAIGIRAMKTTEQEALTRGGKTDGHPLLRVFALLAVVIIGIIASWFWVVGSEFLANQAKDKEMAWGTWEEFYIRVLLAAIIAIVCFMAIHQKIGQGSTESFVPFFVAFQNGFFWQSLLEGVNTSQTTLPPPDPAIIVPALTMGVLFVFALPKRRKDE